ncbi:MAG: hypothetical protein P4L22_07700 [Candidatus Babeliales bacterium]|nr:hypothetical protein [Candidatus Babeliales bacterium]
METCNQNHKRDFAIILSILFHILLFLFLFYKIKEQFDENQIEQPQQNNNPIFLSQDLASQVDAAPESPQQEKPLETEPKISEPVDFATQLIPPEQEIAQIEDVQEIEQAEETTELQDDVSMQELTDKIKPTPQFNELAEELKKFEEFKEAEKKLEKQEIKPVRKRTRKSILPTHENMPTIPNVKDYAQEELKTNYFKMVGNSTQADMKYLSYQQKILTFFERAFAALYVGKTLGIPKHEYDRLSQGVIIEIAIDVNKNGTVKWCVARSNLTKLNECLEHAMQYAAPYPDIPKHFNLEVFSLRTKFPIGLQHSGKGLMQVYPT